MPLLTKRTPGVAGVVGSGATGRRPRPRAAPPAARFVGDAPPPPSMVGSFFGENPLSPVDEDEDASKRRPEYNSRLDAMKVLHDMEPGDAIFHSRYCFHKGERFDEGPCKLRYSIRYMPADARLFDNEYEAALREKGLADGAPLAHAGEYYPQVWPKPIRGERWRVRLGLLKKDGFTKPPPVPSS